VLSQNSSPNKRLKTNEVLLAVPEQNQTQRSETKNFFKNRQSSQPAEDLELSDKFKDSFKKSSKRGGKANSNRKGKKDEPEES